MGDLDTDDILCRLHTFDLGHLVISVDYRLAPEHVYPAAVNDAFDAVVWVREHYLNRDGRTDDL